MCDHSPNREAAMVVLDPGTPERHGRDGVWCDPCLVPLIRALNDGGVRTVASCCGHNRRPGMVSLADGRELFIAPDREWAEWLHEDIASRVDPGQSLRGRWESATTPPAPESPRPPAEGTPGATGPADPHPSRGTGVSGPENSVNLCGWPNVDGWTLLPHPDGIDLYHSCDSRAFLTGPAFPVGAVLAYLDDPPVPDGEPGYTAETVACPACRALSTEEDTE